MKQFYYLATPYSKYTGGIEAAFKLACEQAALLLKAGVPVFSPIAHAHPIAVHGGIDPMDLDTWLDADEPFMSAACGLIMLRADGWQQSRGMAHERETFRGAGKPVFYMDPGVVPSVLAVDKRQRAYERSRHISG